MKNNSNVRRFTSVFLAVLLVVGLCSTGFAGDTAQLPESAAGAAEDIVETGEAPVAPTAEEQGAGAVTDPVGQELQAVIEMIEEPAASAAEEETAGAEEPRAEAADIGDNVNVSGRVTDNHTPIGTPLAGAQVSLSFGTDPQYVTISNPAGEYTLVGKEGSSYNLNAVLDGYKVTTNPVILPENGLQNVQIILVPTVITGRAIRSDSSMIGRSVNVTLKNLFTNDTYTTTTDAGTGVYSFSDYIVTIGSTDSAQFSIEIDDPLNEFEESSTAITLYKYQDKLVDDIRLSTLSISGTVYDSAITVNPGNILSNSVLAGATLTFFESGNPDPAGDKVQTDALGNYVFTEVKLGTTYQVLIECDGYKSSSKEPANDVSVVAVSVKGRNVGLKPVKMTGIATLEDPETFNAVLDNINAGGFARLFNRYGEQVGNDFQITNNGEVSFQSTPAMRISGVNSDYMIKVYMNKYVVGKIQGITVEEYDPGVDDMDVGSVDLYPLKVGGRLRYEGHDGFYYDLGPNYDVTIVGPAEDQINIRTMRLKTELNGSYITVPQPPPGAGSSQYFPNGTYTITVTVNKYQKFERTFVVDFEEADINRGTEQLDATRIRGRVRNFQSSQGLANVRVTLYLTKDRELGNAVPVPSYGSAAPSPWPPEFNVKQNPLTTDQFGYFEFTHVPNMPDPTNALLPDDTYCVVASYPPNYRDNLVNNIVMDNSPPITIPDIGMIPVMEGYKIEGVITDDVSGNLIANAAIRLYDEEGNFLDSTTSRINGEFMLDKVQPGKYYIKVCYRGYALERRDIEIIEDNHAAGTIKLKRKADIDLSGRVYDPNKPGSNRGIPGVTVSMFDKDKKLMKTAVTDANGYYKISYPYPEPSTKLYIGSPYTLTTDYRTIEAEYAFYPSTTINFEYWGYDNDELNFRIPAEEGMYRISGALFESGSVVKTPLAGATVRLEEYYLGTVAETKTDSTGEYHFTYLPSGLYIVYASKQNYTNGEERCGSVQVYDRDVYMLDYIVRSDVIKYAVSGTVGTATQFNNSNLSGGVRVELWVDEDDPAEDYMALNVMTDSQGAYTFPLVEPGKYYVKVPVRTYGGVKVIKGEDSPPKAEVTDKAVSVPNIGIDLEYIDSVASISFAEDSMAVALNGTKQIVAYLHPSNSGIQELTYTVKDAKLATVSSTGVVRGIAIGETEVTVTANDGSGVEATCTVRVVRPATGIRLSNETKSMFVGSRIRLTAALSGNPTENEVTWESDNTRRAQIDSEGYMTGVSRGRALITARSKDGFVRATCIVTVKQPVTEINLTRDSNTIVSGSLARVHASVWPGNANNKKLTYTSGNKSVATVDGEGRIKGTGPGKTTITVRAADGSNTKATYRLTVKAHVVSVKFANDTLRLVKGQKRNLNYSVRTSGGTIKPTFTSSNPSVAAVDSNGKVTAKMGGETLIRARATGDNGTRTATVRVLVTAASVPVQSVKITNAPKSLKVGGYTWLSASISTNRATDAQLSWASSNKNVITVRKDGQIIAKKKGTARIYAKAGGVRTSVVVKVT